MAKCSIQMPAGTNSQCKSYLGEAHAAILLPTDASFDSEISLNDLLAYLKTNLNGFLIEFNGTEPTDAELVTETTGFGRQIITGENAPSLLAYVDSNACDFREVLRTIKGGSYGVLFLLSSGEILGTLRNDKLHPFLMQVWAHRLSIPGRENKTQQFKVTFGSLRGSEFDTYGLAEPEWDINDILVAMPIGASIKVVSPAADSSTSTDMTVYANLRCVNKAEPVLNLETGNPILVDKTFGEGFGINVEAGAIAGNYIIHVEADHDGTDLPMKPNTFIEIMLVDTDHNYVSDPIKIVAPSTT